MGNVSRRAVLEGGLASLLVSSVARAGEAVDAHGLAEIIDAKLSENVKSGGALGAAAGVQMGGGKAHFLAHGTSELTTSAPVSPDTAFRIASVTKCFTALGILRLVEEGRLTLANTLADYFPDFPNGENITIRHLLSHTAGLGEWWDGGLPEDTPATFLMDGEPHKYIQRLERLVRFAPGTAYGYSNSGFVLLGEIIEKVSGEPYEVFLKKEVFDRAGMTHTDYERDVTKRGKNWARGYHQAPDQSPPFAPESMAHLPGAAGALRSSIRDLLSWSHALGSGKIVSKETFARMSTMAKLDDGRPVHEEIWVPEGVELPPPPDFMTGPGYGLGVSLFTSNGQKVVWHSGGIPGFNAIWAYFPHNRLSVAMLSNTDNGVVPAFEPMVRGAVA